jgi:integrase
MSDGEFRCEQDATGESPAEVGLAPTLSAFAVQWRVLYATPNLTPKTMQSYDYLWKRYVEPGIGRLDLLELTPLALEHWKSELLASGVGVESVKRCLVMLQGILQRAVEWQYLASNPARFVRKPPSRRRRAVRPIPPEIVEGMRADFIAAGRTEDALLVCVLAYSGVRPGEALALTWGMVGTRRLLIESCVSLGQVKETKTGRARTVRLMQPLADDLLAYRAQCSRVRDSDLIFPGQEGAPWSESAWRNWRRRIFAKAAVAVGLHGARPYDLRHSFVSLLIAEGRGVIDVARQAGHSPTMALDVYGHVFDDWDPADRISAEERVSTAREQVNESPPAGRSTAEGPYYKHPVDGYVTETESNNGSIQPGG